MWISDIDHLNLRLHDRPGTRGEEAATDTCDARRIARGRYNRWLLGRHRHQDVSPVDGEVAGNADGNPEDPDGILDHAIGLLETQPILGAKRLEDALVEAGRLGQQFMSTAQVQPAKSDPARSQHGLVPNPEVVQRLRTARPAAGAGRWNPPPASSATMLRMILRTWRAAASALTLISLRGPSASKTSCIVSRIRCTRR